MMTEIPHKLKIEIYNIHSLIKECVRKAEILHDRPQIVASGLDIQLMDLITRLKVALGVYEDFSCDFAEKYVGGEDYTLIEEEVKKQHKREEILREKSLKE